LQVNSEKGRGTTVRVTIPAFRVAPRATPQSAVNADASQKSWRAGQFKLEGMTPSAIWLCDAYRAMTATGHEYALNQRRFNSSIGPTAAISTTFRSTGFDPERATGIRSPLSFNGKHISRRRGL